MAHDAERIEELTREIDRLGNTYPHLKPLLQAFGPVFVERMRWLSATEVKQAPLAIDPLRFAEGIPIGQQYSLLIAEDPWDSAGLTAAKAIAQGLPLLGEDMETILRRLVDGDNENFFRRLTENKEPGESLDENAAKMGVSPTSLRLYLRVVSRFLLAQKARDLQPLLTAHAWSKGYCPVCGGFPHLAILGEKGRRLLQCADCGNAWSFPRMVCPYCDHEDPENTSIFFIDGHKEESAFLCEQCKRYLLTVNRPNALGYTHADLIAMSLLHLDIILQEKGYSPMIETDWNGLHPDQD